jgi:hypothetical protein
MTIAPSRSRGRDRTARQAGPFNKADPETLEASCITGYRPSDVGKPESSKFRTITVY